MDPDSALPLLLLFSVEVRSSGSRTRGSYSPISPGILFAVVRVSPVLRAVVVASIIPPCASVAIVAPRARGAD